MVEHSDSTSSPVATGAIDRPILLLLILSFLMLILASVLEEIEEIVCSMMATIATARNRDAEVKWEASMQWNTSRTKPNLSHPVTKANRASHNLPGSVMVSVE